jgi:hypothetical protein
MLDRDNTLGRSGLPDRSGHDHPLGRGDGLHHIDDAAIGVGANPDLFGPCRAEAAVTGC